MRDSAGLAGVSHVTVVIWGVTGTWLLLGLQLGSHHTVTASQSCHGSTVFQLNGSWKATWGLSLGAISSALYWTNQIVRLAQKQLVCLDRRSNKVTWQKHHANTTGRNGSGICANLPKSTIFHTIIPMLPKCKIYSTPTSKISFYFLNQVWMWMKMPVLKCTFLVWLLFI